MKGNEKHVAPSRNRSITWQTTWHTQSIYASIGSRWQNLWYERVQRFRLARTIRFNKFWRLNLRCIRIMVAAFNEIQAKKFWLYWRKLVHDSIVKWRWQKCLSFDLDHVSIHLVELISYRKYYVMSFGPNFSINVATQWHFRFMTTLNIYDRSIPKL